MYNRRRKFDKKYLKYALYTAVFCIAIALVAFGGRFLKRELDAARAVESQVSENHNNNYSADENSSQETQGGIDASSNKTGASPKPTASPKADSYLVTVYEGKIAIFKNDEAKPMRTLDLPLSMLPEEDQKILRAGIHAEGMGELKRILEDYE